mgnify:CR=1 FL=1
MRRLAYRAASLPPEARAWLSAALDALWGLFAAMEDAGAPSSGRGGGSAPRAAQSNSGR